MFLKRCISLKTDAIRRIVYLDSAATSLQKPKQVICAVGRAIRTMTSPGRGGHAAAMRAAETVWRCRSALAELFGVQDPARVVFTMNATHALNIALQTLLRRGDRVVISGYEHNAVMRALHQIGTETDVALAPLFDRNASIEAFREKIKGARAAVVCHVSNVFGFIQPIEDIARICRQEGVPLVVDASQSAGSLCFNFDGLGLRFAAMPGHKGLLGPQGTGVLLCSEPVEPLLAGGTGSDSLLMEMPPYLPDRLEAGTHNVPGIAGLLAGVEWIQRETPEKIFKHECALAKEMAKRLSGIPYVKLYDTSEQSAQAGLISMTVENVDCETIAQRLSDAGIAVRAGYHCAPLAHQSGGTASTGTVRLSFSPFNTEQDVLYAAKQLEKIVKNS